mgnify:FL=1
MKKIRSTLVILTMCVLLTNCASFSEVGKVMRNEKTGNTDEFLIKKREPLTQPPDYNVLPTPNSVKTEKKEKITEILNKNKNTNNSKNKSSSAEQSIIEQIKQ